MHNDGEVRERPPAEVDAMSAELDRVRLALREMEGILDFVPGGVVHLDASGRILRANVAARRLLDLSFDALTGLSVADFESRTVHEDGSPCAAADYPATRALATGEQAGPRTIGVRRRDGGLVWALFTAAPLFDESGSVTGALVTFLDVTEQREAEAQLRSLLSSVPTFIFMTDLEGRIVEINRALPGYEPGKAVGRTVFDYTDEQDAAKLRACMAQVIRLGEVGECEAKGPPRLPPAVYSVRIGPVHVGDRIVALTFSALDVTEQKRLQSQLMVSDRMASVGTLAAGVAHEINNPLTYLTAGLGWALTRLADDPRADETVMRRLRDASEGAARIRDVVRDLGTFSRERDSSVRPVDVREVIESSIRMAGNELRYRASVVREYAPVPRVLVNESRLGQVLLNLIVNAGQSIRAGAVDSNQVTVRTGVAGDGRVRIEVSDTGAGIPDDVAKHVFEPFVTTKSPSSGTGLGLYICHNIVCSFGGTIELSATGPKGTTFAVELPVATEPEVALPGLPRDGPLPVLRVLVVDDEPILRRILSEELRDHVVDQASSGREAIEKIDAGQYDAILCDLIMPDVTGMDVYEHLRAAGSEMLERLILMTGGAFTPRAQQFIEHAECPVVYKPFQRTDIEQALRRIVDRRAAGG